MPTILNRRLTCTVLDCNRPAAWAEHTRGWFSRHKTVYCTRHAAAIAADVVLDPIEALR